MREKPILFSAPMVRAILDGRKTQTRRIVKPQPAHSCRYEMNGAGTHALHFSIPNPGSAPVWVPPTPRSKDHKLPCPYGAPGDRLWVRETWQAIHVSIDPETGYGDDVTEAERIPKDSQLGYWGVAYAATDEQANYHKDDRGFVWRPGIHMPRWASRITLEVTAVRVERLHAITGRDVLAEGVDNGKSNPAQGERWENMQRLAFEELWREINGAESWNANPFVWVVEFKRVETPAAIERAGREQ